jgi:transcriptional regulator with GAF, ATPase, and Fis domain/AmiR/NasT family two-component response regulator
MFNRRPTDGKTRMPGRRSMNEKVLIVEDEFIVAKHLESILQKADYRVCGIAISVPKAMEIILEEEPEIVLLDIFLKGEQTGIDLARALNERNIAFVYLSANSNQSILEAAKETRPYGFMVKPFREDQVLIALDIARYRHINSREADFKKEQLITLQLANLQYSGEHFANSFLAIVRSLQAHIPFDYIEMGRFNAHKNFIQWCSFLRTGFNIYDTICTKEFLPLTSLSAIQLDQIRKETPHDVRSTIYNEEKFDSMIQSNPLKRLYADAFHVKSCLTLPLLVDYGLPFVLTFYSKSGTAYELKMLQFLSRIQTALTNAITNIVADPRFRDEQIAEGRPFKLSAAPTETNSEIPSGIVGKSHPLLAVLDYVEQVATVDTSVLILGETGTGKEKIAQRIHLLSARKDKPLIKVNCAALPPGLIESELFGHEKGSFTGALNKRAGRFEQANSGTIFLDEIGDVPLDIQVKLLRVLQEKEFERVGGTTTIKVDVRIIAATNKNLEKEIAEGRFRMDFYYRLNVFPIVLPPLRERTEDIPLLANHFIQHYMQKHHKQLDGITQDAMNKLLEYHWPGNIRELENSIERSVVLAKDHDMNKVYIQPPLDEYFSDKKPGAVKTLEEVEKEHIQVILNKCNYKIYGPGGAAELLNLPPSTLTSKMKKLGISKD